MVKKSWKAPKVSNLGVDKTMHGTTVTKKPDGSITVGQFTFFSFS